MICIRCVLIVLLGALLCLPSVASKCFLIDVTPASGSTLPANSGSDYLFASMFSSPMYVRVGSAILRLGNLTDFQLSQWWYQNPLVLLRSDSQAHFAENIRLPPGGGDGFVLSYDALPAAANNLYLLFEADALCFDPYCEETTPAMSPAWYLVDNQPSIQDP